MIPTSPALDIPVRTDADGVIRLGATRVTLQSVIVDFLKGASAEEITHHYPVLKLSDVYLVLGYYLQHRDHVDAYIKLQEALAVHARQEYESAYPSDELRAQLLKRQSKRTDTADT